MKNWILFFLSFVILSCSKKHESVIILDAKPGDIIVVENNHNEPVEYSILINNENPHSDFALFKAAGGDLLTPNSLDKIMHFFNYVCDNTFHKNYKTSSNCLYKPSIAINSMGGGLCSVRSGVLTNLLRMNGFNADSYVLTGHVITVVNFDGRNIVLDPDFGLWYYNEKGQIATFEELCSNPKLITNPNNPVLNNSDVDFFIAYSDKTAALYSSVDDNFFLNTGYRVNDSGNSSFLLPQNSVMEFAVFPVISPERYGFVKIFIPAGITGCVSAPLLSAYIDGDCVLEKDDRIIVVNKEFKFTDTDQVIGEFNVIENDNGISIYYYFNPLMFCISKGGKISLVSKSNVLPKMRLKRINYDKNLTSCREDLLDFKIRQNMAIAIKVADNTTITILFESFVSSCKNDSIMCKRFLWDSLLNDYYRFSLNPEYQKKFESMETLHPELLRRFLSTRFDEKYYFTN